MFLLIECCKITGTFVKEGISNVANYGKECFRRRLFTGFFTFELPFMGLLSIWQQYTAKAATKVFFKRSAEDPGGLTVLHM
jgi:hypothetical protein